MMGVTTTTGTTISTTGSSTCIVIRARRYEMASLSTVVVVRTFLLLLFLGNVPTTIHSFTIQPTAVSHTLTTTTSKSIRPSLSSSSSSSSSSILNFSRRLHMSATPNNDNDNNNEKNTKKKKGTIIVVGATGYIGKAVVRECLRQNYQTFAFLRQNNKNDDNDLQNMIQNDFTYQNQSAIPIICDVTNATQILQQMQFVQQTYCNDDPTKKITAVISCLASRSGIKSDAYRIDYQATYDCLQAAIQTQTQHFILLSAFCVQKPLLQFQQAKLKLEAALQQEGTDGKILYTIVRSTAFFKSVSGQLEVVQSGAPFVLFDKGPNVPITSCNPIAESDLATYMVDSITMKERHNQIINLGGPDEPITMLQQGHMLFNATQKEPKFAYAPVWIFDAVINTLQFVADLFQNEKIADMAETGRIGKYYAVEDMVTTLPHEKYGTITLQEHYNRIAVEGNDYDPYTTMFARARGIDVTAIQNDMKNNQNNVTTTTTTTSDEEVKETTVVR